MTNVINLSIKIESPFGNLYRKKLVLIAVMDQENNVLVGSKPLFYPKGIFRLIGGGVDGNEEPIDGAVRELKEEMSLVVQKADLTEIMQFNVHATDAKNNEYGNTNYVYLYRMKEVEYKAGDDIKQIVKLSVDELYRLGEMYEKLSKDDWFKNEMENYNWHDYGKVYGPIHKFVAEKIKKYL